MAYYFLDRFKMPPDVLGRQDEELMNDIMLFDRQVNYKKWARNAKQDTDDSDEADVYESFGPEVMDYKTAFAPKPSE